MFQQNIEEIRMKLLTVPQVVPSKKSTSKYESRMDESEQSEKSVSLYSVASKKFQFGYDEKGGSL